jgi:TRAP-type C4-dicarboxylate transport system permease small subunit
VGAVALFSMMAMTTADVAARYIFNKPIIGVFELTEYLVLILIFSFLGYTQSERGHVSVDLLMPRLPTKFIAAVDLINHLACLALMAIIFWMGIEKALELRSVGEASPNLGIPDYPFVFFLAAGCLVMCFEYLRNIIELIASRKKGSQP